MDDLTMGDLTTHDLTTHDLTLTSRDTCVVKSHVVLDTCVVKSHVVLDTCVVKSCVARMNIRKVSEEDAKSICAIYNYYIENTTVTFETSAVSETEMKQRIRTLVDLGFPYYVGEINDKLVGYYYLHTWNAKCAYSSTNEVTVYLDKEYTGKGFGSSLYSHLLENLNNENVHVLIAGICIPNDDSVRLHEKFGFKQISHMREIGWKFDEWRDVGHWQLIVDNSKTGHALSLHQ